MQPPRATVMGLGLFGGGGGAARHLVNAGYRVTITDLKDETALARSVQSLGDLDVTLRLGGHRLEDFTDTDLVVVNPAVPPGNAFVESARNAGIALDTEIAMFVRACPGRVVGVTGTAGKSTTTALLASCLEGAAPAVHVGGNIGGSLLPRLPEIGGDDLVVLELSSFQLHWLRGEGWRPEVGVITNISPNHLDWHGTADAYARDKAAITPGPGGTLVASADDAGAAAIARDADCRVVWSCRHDVETGDAVLWRDGSLIARQGGREAEILRRGDVRLLGDHAPANVASAAAAAGVLGAEPARIRDAVRSFEGLDHRLKPMGRFGGMLCVDDSKSTTPEAAASALRAFDAPIVLLAGGYDKGIDPAPLVREAPSRARAVVCFGQTGPRLGRELRAAGVERVETVETLDQAVRSAFQDAREGDVLLLSPGHASWDQFENYVERARVFADAVARFATTGEGAK